MGDFDFRGTALELCQRKNCIHYRGEHKPECNGPARDDNGIMIPGTRCPCKEFTPEKAEDYDTSMENFA